MVVMHHTSILTFIHSLTHSYVRPFIRQNYYMEIKLNIQDYFSLWRKWFNKSYTKNVQDSHLLRDCDFVRVHTFSKNNKIFHPVLTNEKCFKCKIHLLKLTTATLIWNYYDIRCFYHLSKRRSSQFSFSFFSDSFKDMANNIDNDDGPLAGFGGMNGYFVEIEGGVRIFVELSETGEETFHILPISPPSSPPPPPSPPIPPPPSPPPPSAPPSSSGNSSNADACGSSTS